MHRWSKKEPYFWQQAPFARLVIPLSLGIACYDLKNGLLISSIPPLVTTLLAGALTISFNYIRSGNSIITLLRSTLFIVSFFLLGQMVSYDYDIRNHKKWFGNKLIQAEGFAVKIVEAPKETERTWKLLVSVDKCFHGDKIIQSSGNAFVYVYKNNLVNSFRNGSTLIVPSGWQLVKNARNPHEFNYAQYCNRKNIYYQQFLNSKDVKVLDVLPRTGLISKSHDWAMSRLASRVKDKATLGLLQAMLLGDEVNFDDSNRQLYVDTGIIHVVAISGGHIAFLMLFITGSLFWLKAKKYQWIKLLIALPVVWFYVWIAGAPPSAIRAAFMFSLLAISAILQKDNQPLNTLFAATFLILVVKPTWLFAIGFQLSCIAVLSLILFYKPVYRLYVPSGKIAGFLWSAIAASVAAEIMIAPMVIYYFHSLPVTFLIANLLAALLMGIVMTLGIAIILLGKISILANWIALVTIWLVNVFHTMIKWLQSLNPVSFKCLYLNIIEIIAVYVIIAAALIFLSRKLRFALFTALVTCMLFLISINTRRWNTLHQQKIIIYNISKHSYIEHIDGDRFTVLSGSNVDIRKAKYAVNENHVTLGAWKEKKAKKNDLILFSNKKILFLKTQVAMSSIVFRPPDYLIIEYPLNEYNIPDLMRIFSFKKIIITGEQHRKTVLRWKDSCLKYNIPAHFTMLDGAYTINP